MIDFIQEYWLHIAAGFVIIIVLVDALLYPAPSDQPPAD